MHWLLFLWLTFDGIFAAYGDSKLEPRPVALSEVEVDEIQFILESTAGGSLANNLTAVEIALQMLLTGTEPQKGLGHSPLSREQLAVLHQKLEAVGDLLRKSTNSQTRNDKELDQLLTNLATHQWPISFHVVITVCFLLWSFPLKLLAS